MTFVDRSSSFALAQGFGLRPAYLQPEAQRRLVDTVLAATADAPFYRPLTPGGRTMSVEITSLGALGWTSDLKGYRYQDRHPLTGRPWPALPDQLIALWFDLVGGETPPDSCLINLYRYGARMGVHQDRDEADMAFPVISISLGDTALFRIGGSTRRAASRQLRLASGDICLLAGAARLAFHGVDRILPGSSRLIPGGGRLNLTLRRAGPAGDA
jgi:alkylated DNA repair protein (DNA oxidative demethylase)